jgi:putative endonuclease
MYFVYILQCGDSTLYTGITTDVSRRLREHKAGTGGHYTRAHGAQKMLYSETASNRSAASKREVEIKKMTRADKLKLAKALAYQKTGLRRNF